MSRRTSMIIAIAAAALLSVSASAPLAAVLSPADAAAAYNRAGALYHAEKYREALDSYESLIGNGIRNPDLFYNAANAAYRCRMTGKAVLYLERALRLSPSDPDALANLEFINSQKQDKEPSAGNPVAAFIARRYEAITVNGAASWSAAAFALMALFAIGALFLSGWKRTVLYSAAAACFLVSASSTAVLVQKTHHSATTVEAVVMTPELNAYSGPGTDNTHIFTLHEGTKVTVERRQESWWLIRMKSGVGGWAVSDSLGVI
jgi:hypothetical protein